MNESSNKDLALASLLEVMASKRYEMTRFESATWVEIIKNVSEDRFLAFLRHHILTSAFAPNPSDAAKYLDTSVNPDVAFVTLTQLVRNMGPYASPANADPILVTAIELLGGWAQINSDMPAQSAAFEMRSFQERFRAAFNQATARVRIEGISPSPLKSLSSKTSGASSALLEFGEVGGSSSVKKIKQLRSERFGQ